MRSAALMTCIVFLTSLVAGAVGPPPPASRRHDIIAAARARQERVRSVDVRFKQTLTIPVNGFSRRFLPKARWRGPMPATEQVVTSVNRLVIAGTKARFDDNHPGWSPDNLKVPPRSHLFDGTKGINFWPDRNIASLKPEWQSVSTTEPLVWTFRLVDPNLGGDRLVDLSPTGQSGRVNGEACVQFDRANSSGAIWLRYHLCPGKGHLPLRIEQLRQGGSPDRSTDITYQPHDVCG